jgi:lipopolysaccharide biosynthesis glycosyltransferase
MTNRKSLPIYVGWDSRQDDAYRVCAETLVRHASAPLEITPLKQPLLRENGLYRRKPDPLASTEFTYTRFLVPHLAGYRGWAMFVDSDFLFTDDVAELFKLADDRFALMCVQHDYRPVETVKMDGKAQSVYPRKNWSSLMLWNCAHPANRVIDLEAVNNQTGAYLHRFQWLDESLIGALPGEWNWLEGWNRKPDAGLPKGIHFTRGGPWFVDWRHVDYADLWVAEWENISDPSKTS